MVDQVGLWISGVGVATAVASWWLNFHRGAVAARIQREDQRERRWKELTPQFDPKLKPLTGGRAELRIRLQGPLGLERLDRVTVKIRDDRANRGAQPLADGPTAEEVAEQIWGPYRLNFDVENTDKTGRTVVYPDGVDVGEDLVCALEKTMPPSWSSMTVQQWQDDEQDGMPLRITIICEREDHKAWSIPLELPRLPKPRVFSA